MLTRLEIDNFRCFEGFVWEPGPKVLILGANGCGKSSMMDVLVRLKSFVAGDARVEELFPLRERTRWEERAAQNLTWLDRPTQSFTLQAEVDGVPYCYRLVVGVAGDPRVPAVQSETLDCGNGDLRVRFEQGTVTIDPPGISYPLKASRSVLSSLNDDEEHALLATGFSLWMEQMRVFRLNPFSMNGRSNREDRMPKADLSNFADWYRWLDGHTVQVRMASLLTDLRETLDGFESLDLQDIGRGVKLLNARFKREDGGSAEYGFEELSEGQRCLICLYTILHFVVVEGGTVIIDEPENFVSLREIQPWLTTAENIVDDATGQLILISHHPEFINQLAPPCGVKFFRDGAGPVRVKPWAGDAGSMLPAAELIARGWDDD